MASVVFTLNDETFEWDPIKAQISLMAHGISFEEACEVFFDPMVIFEADYQSPRLRAKGFTENQTLIIVIFEERDEHYRIITAWKMSKSERRTYEDQTTP
ncbi:MAG: BrnT family toxin [Acidobacteria bacterium]|nr:BrnT family toxin [Acidobacteriota bacterium]MCB9397226.1 BrnT family toxin [Acidobacteriota bacterium]